MNADLLVSRSSVFYLRGTPGEHVLATVVGLSSFLECVAIGYGSALSAVQLFGCLAVLETHTLLY